MKKHTIDELIQNLQWNKDTVSKEELSILDEVIEVLEENQKYHAIGTVEEFSLLKEKVTPKKPIHYDKHYYKCPTCGEDIGVDDDSLYIYEETPPHCCVKCMQVFNWGN